MNQATKTQVDNTKSKVPGLIELHHPILISGVKSSVIKMRSPKVKDMIAISHSNESDAEKEIALFANLCEVSPDDLSEMAMSDYSKLQKAYQDFLS